VIKIGMNARLFPSNWRPAVDEVAFAASAGFDLLQLPGPESGLGPERLGAEPAEVASALAAAQLGSVMEIVLRVGRDARTTSGARARDVLAANLPAVKALGCRSVHIHPAPAEPLAGAVERVEEALIGELRVCAELAADAGTRLGFEHNEPGLALFVGPERCAQVLAEIPAVGLVWDVNHATPGEAARFLELADRMILVHVSDTPLPLLNGHLPLGQGTLDIAGYAARLRQGRFDGPAVLEIGGHPRSGGFGRDDDEALRDSLRRLRAAVADSPCM
jgi:sugar phosphate isomerase/epimerase